MLHWGPIWSYWVIEGLKDWVIGRTSLESITPWSRPLDKDWNFCNNRNDGTDTGHAEVHPPLGGDGNALGNQPDGEPDPCLVVPLAPAAACRGDRGDAVGGAVQ